jgi:FAD synthase
MRPANAARMLPPRAAVLRLLRGAAPGARGAPPPPAAAGLEGVSAYCNHQCSLEAWRRPLGADADAGADAGAGAASAVVVALGKFDALHLGHQELAATAAALGGAPWLVSFAGMAEVLGWPARAPLVAPCDRRRVLAAWAPRCGGRAPAECVIPFAEVRRMSPLEFVRLLAEELRVAGVVVGQNYRFGYKAAGTAELLRELAPAHGLRVGVVGLVGRVGGGEVSSTRVREALAAGDAAGAAACLGRPYRLVAALPAAGGGGALLLPPGALENLAPAAGRYAARAQAAASGWEVAGCAAGGGAEVEVEVRADGGVAVRGAPAAVGGGKLLLDLL